MAIPTGWASKILRFELTLDIGVVTVDNTFIDKTIISLNGLHVLDLPAIEGDTSLDAMASALFDYTGKFGKVLLWVCLDAEQKATLLIEMPSVAPSTKVSDLQNMALEIWQRQQPTDVVEEPVNG